MKATNNMRAKFLFEHFESYQFETTIGPMLRTLLEEQPSLTEQSCCRICKSSDKKTFPVICINNDVFSNNFENLEQAMLQNFPVDTKCKNCGKYLHYQRQYSQHLFIEVIYLFTVFVCHKF